MNLSKIKQIVSEEGKVLIVDNDDVIVVMSFNEYEKTKRKNLDLTSALLDSRIPITVENLEPEINEAPPSPKASAGEATPLQNASAGEATPLQNASAGEAEKPVAELTLDDLPF